MTSYSFVFARSTIQSCVKLSLKRIWNFSAKRRPTWCTTRRKMWWKWRSTFQTVMKSRPWPPSVHTKSAQTGHITLMGLWNFWPTQSKGIQVLEYSTRMVNLLPGVYSMILAVYWRCTLTRIIWDKDLAHWRWRSFARELLSQMTPMCRQIVFRQM